MNRGNHRWFMLWQWHSPPSLRVFPFFHAESLPLFPPLIPSVCPNRRGRFLPLTHSSVFRGASQTPNWDCAARTRPIIWKISSKLPTRTKRESAPKKEGRDLERGTERESIGTNKSRLLQVVHFHEIYGKDDSLTSFYSHFVGTRLNQSMS